MSEKHDTPRTDALTRERDGRRSESQWDYVVPAEFARQLERELTEKQEVLNDTLRQRNELQRKLAHYERRAMSAICTRTGVLMEHDRNDDPRRVFADGAKWWQHYHNGAAPVASEVSEMEREANTRFTLPDAPR